MKKRTAIYVILLVALLVLPLTVRAQTNTNVVGEKSSQNPLNTITDATTTTFEFEGGTLFDFLARIKSVLGIDVLSEASGDFEGGADLKVPKMKFSDTRPVYNWSMLNHVLGTYNSISSSLDGALGKWLWRPAKDGHFDYFLFIPPRSIGVQEITVKAISMEGIPRAEMAEIFRILSAEDQSGGKGRYHESSRIWVVRGPKNYVELALSLVDVYKERAAQKPKTP